MRRRDFLGVLSGVAALPLAVRAQERVRRVGILMNVADGDREAQSHVAAFEQGMRERGWVTGQNLRIDLRWASGEIGRYREATVELVGNSPDVLLVAGAAVGALLQGRPAPCRSCSPIASDPVGAGFVDSLARPGSNATGFMNFEYGLSGKWLELLKQIAPGVTRVAVLRDPAITPGIGLFGAIQSVAPSLGMEVNPVNRARRDRDRARRRGLRACFEWRSDCNGGRAHAHRNLIITLAARHKLPAVYFERFFVAAGGLISYGPDYFDQYRRAAGYVDRILKGEKPADLPVQSAHQVRDGASISRPQRRSASTCRRPCSPAPTR